MLVQKIQFKTAHSIQIIECISSIDKFGHLIPVATEECSNNKQLQCVLRAPISTYSALGNLSPTRRTGATEIAADSAGPRATPERSRACLVPSHPTRPAIGGGVREVSQPRPGLRSEERRVGKECRCRWSPD